MHGRALRPLQACGDRVSVAEWVEAVGGAGGAVFAGLAVLQVVRVRRDEQRDRRTAVTAWAEMDGENIQQSGITVTVRNDTDIALPASSTALRISPTQLLPAPPRPDGTRYAVGSQVGPMVPPRSERSMTYPGSLFQAYAAGWSPIAVSITFPDSTGQIWTRYPNGELVEGLGLDDYRTVAHVYEEASQLPPAKGLRARVHRRRVLRGRPPRRQGKRRG